MFKALWQRPQNGGENNGRPGRGNARPSAARERTESALRRDRLAVSGEGLAELRRDLLTVISGHLPVATEFEEFGLYQEDGEVYLAARVRVERVRR